MSEKNILQEMTAIVREADLVFETVGGSTRHYLRDVLFPLMEKKGLKIVSDESPAEQPVAWISAETKPEHNVGVLVFIPGEDNHITSGMWDISNEWVLLDEYRTPEEEVTHWMPLPAFPNGYTWNEIPDDLVDTIKKVAKEELAKRPKDEQVSELEQLRQWKKEALLIINPIMEYAQGHKDAKLGSSLTEFVIDRCKELDRIKAPEQPVVSQDAHEDDQLDFSIQRGDLWKQRALAAEKKLAEQPVREAEAIEFARWILDNNYKPYAGEWYLNGNHVTHHPRSTNMLYQEFKQPPAEWSGEKEGKL